jgi:hypothetical protein
MLFINYSLLNAFYSSRLTLQGFAEQHDQGVQEVIREDLQGTMGDVVAEPDLGKRREEFIMPLFCRDPFDPLLRQDNQMIGKLPALMLL